MARRQIHRLTDLAVRRAGHGRHADGDGLWLDVSASGSRSWVYIFRWRGRRPEMGLGGYPTVTLAAARDAAAAARRLARSGVNPIDARDVAATAPEFGVFALAVVDGLETGWRNAKHRQQWRNTLETYCRRIWRRPVDAITTDDVLGCLTPIWSAKAETASRVRGRIELVLNAAEARGLRSGRNPAQWRGHLDRLLPRRKRLARGHHAAVAWGDTPALFARLRARQSVSALCLQWTVLTASRTGEAIGARWDEIDREAGVWTVPARRMKSNRPHRVPMSRQCLALLGEMAGDDVSPAGIVFPAQDGRAALSNMAMAMVLRDLAPGATVHGFRSSFRDWAGDATDHPREVIEAALAHVIGDRAEAAYRRGDALEKRRALMQAWADCIWP